MVDELIRRLIAFGFTERNAVDVVYQYMARDDLDGLKDLVRRAELLFDDRKEYPGEVL